MENHCTFISSTGTDLENKLSHILKKLDDRTGNDPVVDTMAFWKEHSGLDVSPDYAREMGLRREGSYRNRRGNDEAIISKLIRFDIRSDQREVTIMEKLATEEAVWMVCDQIASQGRKVSGRAVQNEIGGSLKTIYQHIDSWRARDSKSTVISDIPADVQKTILLALDQCARKATEALSIKMEEAAEREKEVLTDLAESEELITTLGADLSAAKTQIIELQQRLDKESAVAAESICGLREQIGKLDQERNDLILSRDDAKTAAATIRMQLDRADQTVTKSEMKALELEKQVSELIKSTAEAEKVNAVAARHAEDLSGQIAKKEEDLKNTGETTERLESERAVLTRDLNAAVSSYHKAEGVAEQMELRLQECAATNRHLQHELETVRKESALAADQMVLRIQAGEATIHQLQNEIELAGKEESEAGKLVVAERIIAKTLPMASRLTDEDRHPGTDAE